MRSHILIFASLIAFSLPTQAQILSGRDPLGRDVGWEAGFHLGNLLPNQIEGLTEITPQWGLRGSYRTGAGAYLELGGMTGKAEGASYSNVHASVRVDVPIETIVGFVYLGGDAIQYQGVGLEEKTFGGGHVGGGIQSWIADAVWFRADMKFNINPGTALYIGFGFVFRFQDESRSRNRRR